MRWDRFWRKPQKSSTIEVLFTHKFYLKLTRGRQNAGFLKPCSREQPTNISMKKLVSSFVRNESGATAIEYGLIAALISVVIIGVLATVGQNLSAGIQHHRHPIAVKRRGATFRQPHPSTQPTAGASRPSWPARLLLSARGTVRDTAMLSSAVACLSFPLLPKAPISKAVRHQRMAAAAPGNREIAYDTPEDNLWRIGGRKSMRIMAPSPWDVSAVR